jgi:hypothetical protein
MQVPADGREATFSRWVSRARRHARSCVHPYAGIKSLFFYFPLPFVLLLSAPLFIMEDKKKGQEELKEIRIIEGSLCAPIFF